MKMEIDRLTYLVNGKAMRVHREIGPGLDEIVYHERFCELLSAAGIEHQFKPRGQLVHRGTAADVFEADIIIPDLLCLECKAFRGEFVPDHECQIICYQKFWRIRTGLLLNFGRQSLAIKRMLFDEPQRRVITAQDLLGSAPPDIVDQPLAWTLGGALSRLYATYSLGYRATTYRGLILAELSAEQIPCSSDVVAQVPCSRGVREVRLDCLVIDQQCALMILALQDQVTASDRAVLQTYLKYLDLPWGLAVDFGKHELQVRFVRRAGASQKPDRR